MDAIERIVNLKGGFLHFQHDGPMVAKLTLYATFPLPIPLALTLIYCPKTYPTPSDSTA